MVGQHIFVRCRNEQNNAGTWTAAMTDDLVDREIVRNYIEPRCNMDETFAQRALLNVADNNVLRMYHIGDGAMVVSRTYWVTDRITETMGRKGAYSISYVLTEDDVLRFCSDFGGAFDPGCFESYDSLVERTSQNKITINTDYNIFSHGEAPYNPAVFKATGFTKESFVALMNGIYHAIENKKQLAVLLPEQIRRAWEESGDATAEKLAFHIMSLIPDFTRINFGIAAHWSCQVKDKMVSDMHLIFVHPKSEEDILYLKREQIMLLDLDTGKHTSNIPSVGADYFGALWDALDDKESIEDFWAYTKSKYRKLLRGKPNSASAIESVYRIRSLTESNFADSSKLLPAFLLAANEFAGAGTKVPDAEEFLHRVIDKLELTSKPLAPETERALCTVMQYDSEETSHQLQEYEILLYACDSGTATDETVEALFEEITKKQRNAAPFFYSYINGKLNGDLQKPTAQTLKFVCGLFAKICENYDTADLLRAVINILKAWADLLFEENDQAFLARIADMYIGYLGTKASNAELRALAYDFLFKYEQKADTAAQREACTAALFKEEKRIYKAESEMMDNSASLRIFANAFISNLQDVTALKKDTAVNCFTRLFRIAYKGDHEVVRSAVDTYKRAITVSAEEGFSDRVVPVLLSCEEDALRQIDGQNAIWNAQTVGDVLIIFEVVNMNMLGQYAPSEDRAGFLMKWYNKNDVNTYRVCAFYLDKLAMSNRQQIYKRLAANGLIENLFIHVLLGENKPELAGEMEGYFGADHITKLNLILGCRLLDDSYYDKATIEVIFSTWYNVSFGKELRETPFEPGRQFEVTSEIILREYRTLASIYTSNAAFKSIAKEILDKYAYEVFSKADWHNVCELPGERISEIMKIDSETAYEKHLDNIELYEMVQKVDSTVADRRSASMEALCIESREIENEDLVCERIKYLIATSPNPERMKPLWLYYHILYARDENSFSVEEYVSAMGLGDASDSEVAVYLLSLLTDMASRKSQFEFAVGYPIMRYLYNKMSQDLQAFNRDEIRRMLTALARKDYVRNSGLARLFTELNNSNRLRFNASMFIKCLFGSVVTFMFSLLIFLVLVILGRIDTIVMISVGAFIFIILAAIGICLLPKKSSRSQKVTGGRR